MRIHTDPPGGYPGACERMRTEQKLAGHTPKVYKIEGLV